VLPQERELCFILLKAHHLLFEMRRHAGRVLPLLDLAEQVQVVDV
jgi:hypothetical protein